METSLGKRSLLIVVCLFSVLPAFAVETKLLWGYCGDEYPIGEWWTEAGPQVVKYSERCGSESSMDAKAVVIAEGSTDLAFFKSKAFLTDETADVNNLIEGFRFSYKLGDGGSYSAEGDPCAAPSVVTSPSFTIRFFYFDDETNSVDLCVDPPQDMSAATDWTIKQSDCINSTFIQDFLLLSTDGLHFEIKMATMDESGSGFLVFDSFEFFGDTACPAGKKNFTNFCVPCERGSYSSLGEDCEDCPLGKFQAQSGMSSCDDCPVGSFTNVTGSSACSGCGAGYYNTKEGSTSTNDCQGCNTGYFQSINTATECTPCPYGEYQDSIHSASCEQCPQGSFGTKEGSDSDTAGCEFCPKGTYTSLSGQTTCDLCPAGTFQSEEGKTSCINCEAGTWSTKDQAIDSLGCESCSVGFYSEGGVSECTICPPGKFQNITGQDYCYHCPTGTFNSKEGSTHSESCIPCPVGTYADSSGSAECEPCPPGRFQSTEGMSICSSCSIGQYSTAERATTSGECQECDPGTYQGSPGYSYCIDCLAGTFQSSTGQASCDLCLPAFYQDEEGQISCKQCPAGTFTSTEQNEECQLCPLGTWSDTAGLSECFRCPPGQFNTNEGSTTFSDCVSCGDSSYNWPVSQSDIDSSLTLRSYGCQLDSRAAATGSKGDVILDIDHSVGCGVVMVGLYNGDVAGEDLAWEVNTTNLFVARANITGGFIKQKPVAIINITVGEVSPVIRYSRHDCSIVLAYGNTYNGTVEILHLSPSLAIQKSLSIPDCEEVQVNDIAIAYGWPGLIYLGGRMKKLNGTSAVGLYDGFIMPVHENGTFGPTMPISGEDGETTSVASVMADADGGVMFSGKTDGSLGGTSQEGYDFIYASFYSNMTFNWLRQMGSSGDDYSGKLFKTEGGLFFSAMFGNPVTSPTDLGEPAQGLFIAQFNPLDGSIFDWMSANGGSTSFSNLELIDVRMDHGSSSTVYVLVYDQFVHWDDLEYGSGSSKAAFGLLQFELDIMEKSDVELLLPGSQNYQPPKNKLYAFAVYKDYPWVVGSAEYTLEGFPSASESTAVIYRSFCPYGYIRGPNGCVQCPIGSYSEEFEPEELYTCANCEAGTYGSYSASYGANVCADCDDGTYTVNSGAIDSTQCLGCILEPSSGGYTGISSYGAICALKSNLYISAAAVDESHFYPHIARVLGIIDDVDGICGTYVLFYWNGNNLDSQIPYMFSSGGPIAALARYNPVTGGFIWITGIEYMYSESSDHGNGLISGKHGALAFGKNCSVHVRVDSSEYGANGFIYDSAGTLVKSELRMGGASWDSSWPKKKKQTTAMLHSVGGGYNYHFEAYVMDFCDDLSATFPVHSSGTGVVRAFNLEPYDSWEFAPGDTSFALDASYPTGILALAYNQGSLLYWTGYKYKDGNYSVLLGAWDMNSGTHSFEHCMGEEESANYFPYSLDYDALNNVLWLTASKGPDPSMAMVLVYDTTPSVVASRVFNNSRHLRGFMDKQTGSFYAVGSTADTYGCQFCKSNPEASGDVFVYTVPLAGAIDTSQLAGKVIMQFGSEADEVLPVAKAINGTLHVMGSSRGAADKDVDWFKGFVSPTEASMGYDLFFFQEMCPPGSHVRSNLTDLVNSVGYSCTKCAKGHYMDTTNRLNTCMKCPADTYASQLGSFVCNPCDSGKTSEEGSSECEPTPTPSPTLSPTPTTSASPTVSASPTLSPTVSASPTLSPTPTTSASPTVSASPTLSPTSSASPTLSPTVSASPTLSPTVSASPTLSPTVSASPTLSPTVSASPTLSPTVSASPTLSPTVSASPTLSPTVSASPTLSPTISASPTLSPTVSASPTLSPTVSASPTLSPSPTLAITPTASPSISPTASPTPCLPGFYNNYGYCQECYSGYSDSYGATTCTPCPEGKIVNSSRATSEEFCESCLPGFYYNYGYCQECYSGYSDSYGATTCTPCPEGKIVNSSRATSEEFCESCELGTVASYGYCSECLHGQYSSTEGATACEDCVPGTYSSGYKATSCTPCGLGQFSYPKAFSCESCGKGMFNTKMGQSSCEKCSAGTFASLYGRTECTPCSAGTFQASEGGQGCFECPAGTWAAEGANECTLCDSGTFSTTVKAISSIDCQNCGEGEFSSPGSTTCGVCGAGTYENKTTGLCVNCPGGTFSAGGIVECLQCETGSWSGAGQSTCNSCFVGFYSTYPGAATSDHCIPCEFGRYGSAEGITACDFCPAGKFSTTTQSTSVESCDECTKGHFSSKAGSTICTPCSIGTYIDITGAEKCNDCPVGLYSTAEGSQSCVECGKGYFTSNTRSTYCAECSPGTYSDATGRSNCLPCEVGHYQSASLSFDCTPCESGKFQSLTGQIVCEDCPVGYFSDQGSSNCKKCPIGKWASIGGSSECTDCPAGQFSDEEGSTECQVCGIGEYSDVVGSSTCMKCATGKWSSNQGQSTCNPCPAGSYQNQEGSSTCNSCQIGRWASKQGQENCTLCLPGSWASEEGKTLCDSCGPGRYQSNEGATSCVPCDIGHWNSLDGQSKCQECIAGTFTSSVEQTECEPCSVGYYQSLDGKTVCEECHAGYFASKTGQDLCTPCNSGTWNTEAGQTTCISCGEGQYQSLDGQTFCETCQAGTWASGGFALCTDCEKDTYSTSVGATSPAVCTNCDPGKFSSPGSTACGSCPSGNYEDGGSCYPCQPGRYSMGGLVECLLCSPGTWSAGGNDSSKCIKCLAGYYSTSTGASTIETCDACQPGTYQSEEGKTKCIHCKAGKWSTATAAASDSVCQNCAAGYWLSSTGASHLGACESCIAGTWSSSIGATTDTVCIDCDEGTWSGTLALGSPTGCLSCIAGTYSAYKGATSSDTCTECSPGTYSTEEGASSADTCKDCGIGTFANIQGSTTCVDCTAGSWSSIERASACEMCDAGLFSTQEGQTVITTCQQCDNDTYSGSAGSSECTPCPSALYGSFMGWSECLLKDCEGTPGGDGKNDPCGICRGNGSSCFGIDFHSIEGYARETDEFRSTTMFAVSLTRKPAVPEVIIKISVDDSSEGCCPNPEFLIFNASRYDEKQNVTVQGVPDAINDEGDTKFNVIAAGYGTSSGWYQWSSNSLQIKNRNVNWPSILSFNPAMIPTSGTVVTVIGKVFLEGVKVRIDGEELHADNVTRQSDTKIIVTMPPASPGYHRVSVYNTDGTYAGCPKISGSIAAEVGIRSCKSEDELYWSNDCPLPGTWGKDGNCKACDACAICKGGNRIWAAPGCYSPNEQTAPIACKVKDACLGGRDNECAAGYSGPYCSDCAAGYFKDLDLCSACTGAGDEGGALLYVAGAFFMFLSLGVMILPDNYLDFAAVSLVPIQQIVNFGLLLGETLPSSIREVFRILSLLSFEFDFVKPGCTIGTTSFYTIFYVTLGVAAGVVIMFAFAALGRGTVAMIGLKLAASVAAGEVDNREEKAQNKKFKEVFLRVFRRRLMRAISILLAIVYLVVTSSLLKAIYCIPDSNGDLVLYTEMSKSCYQGEHLVVSAVAFPLLLAYSLGFPTWVVYTLWKNRTNLQAKETRQKYGFLYRGLQPQRYWYRSVMFFVSAFICIERTFAIPDMIRVASTTGIFLLSLSLTLLFRPFKYAWRNTTESGAAVAQIVIALIVLGGMGDGDGYTKTLVGALAAVLGVQVLIAVAHRLWQKYKRKGADKSTYVQQMNEGSSERLQGTSINLPYEADDDSSSEDIDNLDLLDASDANAMAAYKAVRPPSKRPTNVPTLPIPSDGNKQVRQNPMLVNKNVEEFQLRSMKAPATKPRQRPSMGSLPGAIDDGY